MAKAGAHTAGKTVKNNFYLLSVSFVCTVCMCVLCFGWLAVVRPNDCGAAAAAGSAQLDGLVVEGSDIVQRAVLY